MEKRGWKVLKNNLLSVILVVSLICLGVVFAGNVFVDRGSMEIDENLTVTGIAYLDKFQIGDNNITDDAVLISYAPVDDSGANSLVVLLDPTTSTTGDYNNYAFTSGVGVQIPEDKQDAGTKTAIYGSALHEGAGNLTGELYGLNVQVGTNTMGSGKVNEAAGVRIKPYIKNGTVTNFYGIFGDSPTEQGAITNKYFIWDNTGYDWALDSDNQKILFGESQDASIYFDGTNFVFDYGTGGGDLAYFTGNVSALDYYTRTSVYDKSKGSALSFIKDADDYLSNGETEHSEFYGYTTYEVTDFSKPETEEVCEDECYERVIYPHTKIEEGVNLNAEIDLLRQAVFELKSRLDEVCEKNRSYSWC